jgi:hypothetical protein
MVHMNNRGAQLFCSLFILVGLVALGIGIWTFAKSIRAEHWPVTDGIFQSVEMKSHEGEHGDMTYSAEVTYGYQVAGTGYTGDKVAIGQMSSSSEYAQGILDRYPVGKKVSVHYSPGNASDAVLFALILAASCQQDRGCQRRVCHQDAVPNIVLMATS